MPARNPTLTGTEGHVRAERFQSALQPRVIRSAGLYGTGSFRAVLLERGRASLSSDRADQELIGPVVAWLPWTEDMRLRLAAGSQGTHLLLGPQALSQALRNNPEATELTFMANRPALLSLTEDRYVADTLTGCFHAILSETQFPKRMTAPVISAMLGVMLIHLFRGQPAAAPGGGPAMAQPLATRFVTLVETHYHEQWTVQQYAATLKISRDRLNDICRRALDRTPSVLIRSRVMLEARRLLEDSDLSVDQIGSLLGFASAPQFNRFFKSLQGHPPGRYRARSREAFASDATVPAAPYDWP